MKTLALAAVCVTIAVTAAAHPPASSRDQLVVTPAWLAEHLKDPDLIVLQVGERKTYDAGHVPGARFVNVTADLAAPAAGDAALALEMPPADVLRDRLEVLGISDGSRVVVVESDDWWSPSTRLVFTLDYAGIGRTSWLDGGLTAWKAAGEPTAVDAPPVSRGKLSPLQVKPIVVDAGFVEKHAHAPGFTLVDARAPAFYDGTQPGGRRGGPLKAGHIPGAVSAPFSEFTTPDVHLKSPGEIAAVFDRAGVRPADTVIAYCHIGQQATAVLFAARTLGHAVLLYDGSFEDWAMRNLPVDTQPVKDPVGKNGRVE